MAASDFAAMLYDESLVVRIRENIGLTATCIARSGLIDRVANCRADGCADVMRMIRNRAWSRAR